MHVRLAALSAAILALTAVAGPVTPPAGPIAPTMKPLDQVEPRTPLSNATTPGDAASVYRITAPGSYYLTGNLNVPSGKNGVVIAAPNVTLDMAGFAMTGAAGSLDGVTDGGTAAPGANLRNGTFNGIQQNAVYLVNSGGVRVRDVSVTASHGGIALGEGALIESCSVTNTGTGFAFTVLFNGVISRCTAVNGQGPGFQLYEGSIVKDSSARFHTDGFVLNTKSAAIDCAAAYCTDDGFVASSGCRIERCTANDCSGDGFQAGTRARIEACTALQNSGAGVRLDDPSATLAANSSVTGLFARGNNTGILCADTNCVITGNRCVNNSINYSIVANNHVGPIVSQPVSGAINGSSGGAGMGTTDPYANFAN